jgi:hypothetical protein
VRAFLITQHDGRIKSHALNCNDEHKCEGLPGWSKRTFEWNLPLGVYPRDVCRFGLSFESDEGKLLTGDNWDLIYLEVSYVVAVGSKTKTKTKPIEESVFEHPMFNATGNPLYRFKTKDEWQSGPLKLAP